MKFSQLLCFLLISSVVHAQGIWTQKANMPGNGRVNMAGFSSSTKGYISGGSPGGLSSSADCSEFDPGTNTWATKAQMPVAFRAGTGFSASGKGFMTTGVNTMMFIEDLYMYNILGDNWSVMNPFLGPVRMYASGFSVGSKGYISCGTFTDLSLANDLYEYDPDANTWTMKASLPGSGRSNATAFSVGQKAYIMGGQNDFGSLTDLWEYNTTTDTWMQRASFPGPARTDATAFSLGNKAYIVGGWGDMGSTLPDVWEYNPSTDAWTQLADFPGNPVMAATSFTIGNKAYVVGGSGTNECWEFSLPVSGLEAINTQGILCYPNPTGGVLTVLSIPEEAVNSLAQITDLSGNVVLERTLTDPAHTSLDLSSLESGLYVLKLIIPGTGIQCFKITLL